MKKKEMVAARNILYVVDEVLKVYADDIKVMGEQPETEKEKAMSKLFRTVFISKI